MAPSRQRAEKPAAPFEAALTIYGANGGIFQLIQGASQISSANGEIIAVRSAALFP
jgi:hypothetical protein